MIQLPAGTRIWIAAGVTDMRRVSTVSVHGCRPCSTSSRSAVVSLHFEGAEATSLSFCGGMEMAYAQCRCFWRNRLEKT